MSILKPDDPRRRLMGQDIHTVTDSELIAILMDIPIMKAIQLTRSKGIGYLAQRAETYLYNQKSLKQESVDKLVAAKELCRRWQEQAVPTAKKISTAELAYNALKRYKDDPTENFFVLAMTSQLQIKHIERISIGGLNYAVVVPSLIAKVMIVHDAISAIIAHNHPSGILTPSRKDIELTRQTKKGLRFLSLTLLDHIIFGPSGYHSLAEHGELPGN